MTAKKNCSETIPFPSVYKNALSQKKKNMTIRIGNEVGRYEAGRVYRARSYAGRDWKMKIKVNKVVQANIDKLADFKIPAKEVENIKKIAKRNNLPLSAKADLINFEIIEM